MDASQAPEVVPSQEAPQVYYGRDKYEQERNNNNILSNKPEKRIMGLRAVTFWLLVVLFVVVVAAAVGGGVGGSMAVQNAKKQSSESSKPSDASASSSPPTSSTISSSGSPTTTSGGAYVAPTNVILPLPCDDRSPSVSVAGQAYKFNATCGVDHPKGDLLPIVAYSFHDCLASCAKYNSKWGEGGCAGVVFGADLAKFVAQASGNCFLKNSTSSDVEADGVIAAVLL